jgi:hypothetical protein
MMKGVGHRLKKGAGHRSKKEAGHRLKKEAGHKLKKGAGHRLKGVGQGLRGVDRKLTVELLRASNHFYQQKNRVYGVERLPDVP